MVDDVVSTEDTGVNKPDERPSLMGLHETDRTNIKY